MEVDIRGQKVEVDPYQQTDMWLLTTAQEIDAAARARGLDVSGPNSAQNEQPAATADTVAELHDIEHGDTALEIGATVLELGSSAAKSHARISTLRDIAGSPIRISVEEAGF